MDSSTHPHMTRYGQYPWLSLHSHQKYNATRRQLSTAIRIVHEDLKISVYPLHVARQLLRYNLDWFVLNLPGMESSPTFTEFPSWVSCHKAATQRSHAGKARRSENIRVSTACCQTTATIQDWLTHHQLTRWRTHPWRSLCIISQAAWAPAIAKVNRSVQQMIEIL